MSILNYLKSISATSNLITDKHISEDEASRLGRSDLWWANKRNKPFSAYKIKKGNIYQFEFGKNIVPEMSYEHRGLVIGISKQLLYVLPIFSYIKGKHTDIYGKDNKGGNLYLLKAADHSFLKHDSILKLNDIRTVSAKRIMYQYDNGLIDPTSNIYKEIQLLAFSRCFPELHYELMNYRKSSGS